MCVRAFSVWSGADPPNDGEASGAMPAGIAGMLGVDRMRRRAAGMGRSAHDWLGERLLPKHLYAEWLIAWHT